MREIPLTKGKVALVDDEDFGLVAGIRWHADHHGKGERPYAVHSEYADGKRVASLRMHRYLVRAEPGQVVDHIDGNTLNNTRANLRVCTPQQNHWNSRKPKGNRVKNSQYKGVYRQYTKDGTPRWRAQIQKAGCNYLSHPYSTDVEAARAYDAMALKHFGEFARLNFPALQSA